MASECIYQENDLESDRRCMLKLFHTYIQTHAGYAIGIAVGASAIAANYRNFVELNLFPAFLILILFMIGWAAYQLKRILYWTSYANVILGINSHQLEMLFERWYIDDCRVRFEKKLPQKGDCWRDLCPNTYKLTQATSYFLKHNNEEKSILHFVQQMRFNQFAVHYTLIAAPIFLIFMTFNQPLYYWYFIFGLASSMFGFSFFVGGWYLWRKNLEARATKGYTT
jgi:hypothetical protein